MLRIHPVTAFRATSCSVVRAIPGDTTAWAGCVTVSAIAVTAPRTYVADRWRIDQQRGRCGGHRHGLRPVRAEEDATRPEAIDQRACERREQRGRHQERERHEAGRGRATLLIREHEDRDPGAELREAVERERGSLPTEQAIRGQRAQRRGRRRHAGRA